MTFFMLSGAVFPLLMTGPDGLLDAAARSRLRMLALPGYGMVLLLLLRKPMLMARAGMAFPAILVLMLLPFLSTLWSISGSLTLRRSVGLILSMALAYLLATRFSPRQQWLVFSILLAGMTLASMAVGFLMPDLGRMPEDPAMRGIFTHKNVLGWIAAYTYVFGLAALNDPMRLIRRCGLALIVIGIAGGVLSTSATSLVAVAVASLAYWIVNEIARHRGLARALAQLCVVLVICAIGALIAFGLLPLLDALGKDITLTGRVPLWHLLDPEIAKRPIIGYGFGAFWSDANPTVWDIWAKIQWDAPHAHNGYRDILLSLGIVGLAVFLYVVVRTLSQGIDLVSQAPGDGWMWCVLTIVTTLVLNLSESSILAPNDPIWIMCSTAMMTIAFRHSQRKATQPRSERLSIAAA